MNLGEGFCDFCQQERGKGGGLTAKLVLGAANKKRANPRHPELLGSWHQVEARTNQVDDGFTDDGVLKSEG